MTECAAWGCGGCEHCRNLIAEVSTLRKALDPDEPSLADEVERLKGELKRLEAEHAQFAFDAGKAVGETLAHVGDPGLRLLFELQDAGKVAGIHSGLRGAVRELVGRAEQAEARLAEETKAQDEVVRLLHKQIEDLEARLAKVVRILPSVCQVFDGWHQDGTAWTEWDESVRREVSELLAAAQPEEEKRGRE